MKYALTAGLIATGLAVSVPAVAQGVYVGPGGVGVDTGFRRHRDWDRDRDSYRDHRFYEGRSAYRDRHYDDRY